MSGGTAAPQLRNTELVDILSTDFIRRNEATVAWKAAISMFQMLPGLRGFWPFSSYDDTLTYDLSGQARHLTRNNVTHQWIGLPATCYFASASTRYFNRADEAGLDILGNEAYMSSGYGGLTVGGWFNPTNTTNLAGYITKYTNVAATSAFALHQSTTNANSARFVVYSGGSNYPVVSAADSVSTGAWHFIIGRYLPSTKVSVFVDGTFTDFAVGIPASITNSTADLEIGRLPGAPTYYTGYGTLCFLCGAALSDTIIQSLYHHSKNLFGA